MVPLLLLPVLFGALSQAEGNHQDVKYKLEIKSKAPQSAPTVPANFFGFGFETAFFHHFGNNFSENIVNSIGGRMNAPITIRIGGTSGDLVQYRPDQDKAADCVPLPGCIHSSESTFTLGPSYFETFKWFQEAHLVIQAPISPKINEKNWRARSMKYIREATGSLEKAAPGRLAAIALGNEPNWYDYGLETYVSRALDVQQDIVHALGLKGDAQQIFQVGEIPNEMITPKRSYKYGLIAVLKSKINNKLSKFAAQHFYQFHLQKGQKQPSLQSSLMNHKAITARFPPIDNTINHIKADGNKLDYVISETGSAIGNADYPFSGAFGAALWAVDFHLYAMTRGVKRISNTMRPEATHAYWIPDNPFSKLPPKDRKTNGPSVHGMFPSAPFIADFVGTEGKVVEVPVPGTPETFSAYAMYDVNSGALKRVALVNLVEWNPSMPRERGNATITLDFGESFEGATDDGLQPASVHRMHADNGAAAKGFDLGGFHDNVTWAGEQWTFKVDTGRGHFPHGKENEPVTINDDGKATVTVPDSEAVIVSFK